MRIVIDVPLVLVVYAALLLAFFWFVGWVLLPIFQIAMRMGVV